MGDRATRAVLPRLGVSAFGGLPALSDHAAAHRPAARVGYASTFHSAAVPGRVAPGRTGESVNVP